MSGSRTIIAEEDRLANVHPGDILREDFLIGSEIDLCEVAAATGLAERRLEAVIDGTQPVDADLDLRLGRYFGMSEGFFLRLQNSFDIEEAKRTGGEAIERITRRAA